MKFFRKEKSKAEVLELALKRLEKKSVDQLFNTSKRISLENFTTRAGNVSAYELQVLSLIIKSLSPKILLEIGTFDGTTTLQMALNSPHDAIVHTLDLPPGQEETLLPSLSHDKQYIINSSKMIRKFKNNAIEKKNSPAFRRFRFI